MAQWAHAAIVGKCRVLLVSICRNLKDTSGKPEGCALAWAAWVEIINA